MSEPEVRGVAAPTTPETPAPVLRGLARNPGAPADVLLRLIDVVPGAFRKRAELPGVVQEAMAGHPERRVRVALADHPSLRPDLRERLLHDPEWTVAVRAFTDRLTDGQITGVLTRMADSDLLSEGEIFEELQVALRFGERLYRLAAAHPEARVRRYAAPHVESLADDPDPVVRQAAAESRRPMGPADLPAQHSHGFWWVLQLPLTRELVDQVVASDDDAAKSFVAFNPTTPPDVVRGLMSHPDPAVRRGLATRSDLLPDQLSCLVADPDVRVRTAVSVHPGLSEERRAAIDIEVPPFDVEDPVPVGEPAAALSVNPLLRRRAARNPELTVDLSGDPDLGVRVLYALHHPAAPPELLLHCFLENQVRDRLLGLPQFPTDGLAVYADHPDPAVRRLAARDPQAPPELIARLAADPELRPVMAACPRLPRAELERLLADPKVAEHAAANPSLPVERIRELLSDPR